MTAISNRLPPVTIEYTARERRVRKTFADAYVGRRFYTRQDKLGSHPKVVGAKTMSETNTTTPVVEATPVNETLPVSTPVAAEKPMNKKAKRQAKQAAKKAATATPVKKATKKASVKKAATKAAPTKAAKKTPTTTAKGVEWQATKEIRWTDKKIELLKALKKAGATSASSSITAEKIQEVSKGQALSSLAPHFDFVLQGYVGLAEMEGQREHGRYITAKGLKKLESLTKK